MPRILITGMSGSGKTTVLQELSRRGYRTIDTDYDGWVLPDGTWDEPRMSTLLASHSSLVDSGTVENQGRFYDRFSAVVLLSAPVEVLIERVSVRTNNTYGSSEADQSAIRKYVLDVEPLLRNGATLELDGRRLVPELADWVERLITESDQVSRPEGDP
ncbi:shikimate kinase [Pseudarthrobacter defluvii]|uniref:AAA family ATPase n=1 Tax=Pseudarthrobacter defluvii TaxID=410837 RepID=UPI00277E589B|nr:AAA family ATPase [Pseudarthrobacter defluvii]MDQ0770969.1 shikimate kinase [Pseudarthrobacter defluvii]